MATGIVIAGRGNLRVDGKILSATSLKVKVGAEKSSKIVSMRGPVGDKVEAVVPTISATIALTNDVTTTWLNALSDVTVEVECASGRAFVFEGCSITEPPEYDVAEGTADIAFECLSGTEV